MSNLQQKLVCALIKDFLNNSVVVIDNLEMMTPILEDCSKELFLRISRAGYINAYITSHITSENPKHKNKGYKMVVSALAEFSRETQFSTGFSVYDPYLKNLKEITI